MKNMFGCIKHYDWLFTPASSRPTVATVHTCLEAV